MTELALRDGTPAMVWPLLPTDVEGLRAGFRALSPGSRWQRFLTGLTELDDRMIGRLVHGVDGSSHIALVLVAFPPGGQERPVGVARLVQDGDDPTSAEVAFTVADDWQGRGVGAALGRALVERRPPAVRRFTATVAADNAASLALLARLGHASVRSGSPGVVDVTVDLDPALDAGRDGT